eukprot:1272613-Amphidinium_carterae.1
MATGQTCFTWFKECIQNICIIEVLSTTASKAIRKEALCVQHSCDCLLHLFNVPSVDFNHIIQVAVALAGVWKHPRLSNTLADKKIKGTHP